MNRLLREFPFQVTLQCTYSPESSSFMFTELLGQLEQIGFFGIELNLPELSLISPQALLGLLERHHLKLTWLATGAYAKRHEQSLSAVDSAARACAVEGCKRNVEYAAAAGCGIIIGFFKSNPAQEIQPNEALLIDSLRQICTHAEHRTVPVLLEATNRYESRAANTLEQTAAIVREVGVKNLGILPDTFHMNIEEARPMDALAKHLSLASNLHISDNNRYFPGFGSIDFSAYLRHISKLGYHGTLGIEGNVLHSLTQDIAESAAFLASLKLH